MIHVQEIDPTGRVRFASELGAAEAAWMGEPPAAGRDYAVELVVGDRLIWGDSIVAAEPAAHAIATGDDGTTLVATLESVDEDGAATLRLGPSLVLVETEGEPAPVGTTVRVRLADLVLADTSI